MKIIPKTPLIRQITIVGFLNLFLISCAVPVVYAPLELADSDTTQDISYKIGAGEGLEIYVWRNPEISSSIQVRPDGKISTPLVEDLVAVGKTPTQLARDIERELSIYIKEPLVTVMVRTFVGPYDQQIRVVGEAAKPSILRYSANITLLDVMIAVGGLTDFAAGNKASIIRKVDGQQRQLFVRLDSLIRDGEIGANVPMQPGDILIIPESWF
ncbi:MAG: sugar ABC transporter substrate-binding protein [Gammaproteobacteria bacterium]|nr:sugar ABC transporter substrate-binding protein [Gammaproteobacteria bacterium]